MLSALIIVFREIIEAGLIVGVALAATAGAPRRGLWVAAGILAGAAGAGLVALGAGRIAALFSGSGQELFNAGILLLSVAMLTWHNVWMASHGRAMTEEMRRLGDAVLAGRKSMLALAAVCGLAVLREGSEIVLFLYSIAVSGSQSPAGLLLGGGLGLLAGAAVSAALFLGLLTIPTRYLFGVTSGLITLLAAGLASQAVAFLQQGGYFEVLTATVWDTSWLLADDSIAGRLVHTLVGYTARPDGAQVVCYLATVAVILGLMGFGRAARAR